MRGSLPLLAGFLASSASGGSIVCTITTGSISGATCVTTPTVPTLGQNFTITIEGTCSGAVSTSTYDMTGTFAGIPILNKKGLDGCSPTDFSVGGALNLGHVYIGGATCPIAAAGALKIVSQALVGVHAPPGTLKTVLTTKDQAGAELFSINLDVTTP